MIWNNEEIKKHNKPAFYYANYYCLGIICLRDLKMSPLTSVLNPKECILTSCPGMPFRPLFQTTSFPGSLNLPPLRASNTRAKLLRMRKLSIFKLAVPNANFTTRMPVCELKSNFISIQNFKAGNVKPPGMHWSKDF